jgi:hypothetical protein
MAAAGGLPRPIMVDGWQQRYKKTVVYFILAPLGEVEVPKAESFLLLQTVTDLDSLLFDG